MIASIQVEGGDTRKALQGFLQELFAAQVVEALLVPMRTPGGAVVPALVTDPGLLGEADLLAPVLPVNGATLAGQLSVRPPGAKVGVLLRACELRALVELAKMQQANLEHLTLIALDCAGTYSLPLFRQKSLGEDGGELWLELYRRARLAPGSPDPNLRPACQICEQPVYPGADIAIELLGGDPEQEIRVALPDELGEKLGCAAAAPGERDQTLEALVQARAARREEEFSALRARLEGGEGLAGVLDACIRCHNCMTVCPLCYCKTCVFKSPLFDHEPAQLLNWAEQKGACRLPADTLLFHLTRLNHMVLSCVGCGMCTEACPAELPVGLVFRAVGQRLQTLFDYAPGRSPAEPPPLITFKADEWTEVGE